MKPQIIVYVLIAIAQIALLIYYFFFRNSKQTASDKTPPITQMYQYEMLRSMAFNAMPGALLNNLKPEDIRVYSVIMDWDMGNDTVTLATQITGETNLYVKSGGAILGTSKFPNISNAAQQFTILAQNFLSFALPAEDTSLPQSNDIHFYLLTNKGTYLGIIATRDVETGASAWKELFEAASNVINQMRLAATIPDNEFTF